MMDMQTKVRLHMAKIYHTLQRLGFTLFIEPSEKYGEHLQFREDEETAPKEDEETINRYLTMALDWSQDMMEYIKTQQHTGEVA